MSVVPQVPEELPQVEKPPVRERLAGNIGVFGLLFMVLAFNGPLSGVIGYLPVVIGYGNGLGAPMAYVFGAVLLGLFAVGFMKMAPHIKNPGGFYSFISAGLRTVGLGASMVALIVYYVIIISSSAFFGLSMTSLVEGMLHGPNLPWWIYSLSFLVITGVLGYFRLDLSAKILTILLGLELLIVAVYDAAVVLQGGAEGLTANFALPSNFLSGSVGLALMFATITFGGFEATVVFRHEVRDPDRTIPRATYGFLLLIGVFYAFSAWVITQAIGETTAVEATAADPTGSVLGTFEQYLGMVGFDTVTILLNTSIIAAIISMHNVLTRYVFNLAGDGVFPHRLSKVHPTQKSPHRASVLTSVFCIVGLLAFVVTKADVTILYAQLGGIFGYGLLILMTVTDIAVMVYLNRTRPAGATVWHRLVAPILALIGLVVVLVLGTINIDTLLGVPKETALWLCSGLYLIWILGSLWARVLKNRQPEVYQAIGRQ